MRLHRLTLRDVKGVRECAVDFPDRGVLVIEGPNEVGKSTLLDGFDALLTLKATSRAAAARALGAEPLPVPADLTRAELLAGHGDDGPLGPGAVPAAVPAPGFLLLRR